MDSVAAPQPRQMPSSPAMTGTSSATDDVVEYFVVVRRAAVGWFVRVGG